MLNRTASCCPYPGDKHRIGGKQDGALGSAELPLARCQQHQFGGYLAAQMPAELVLLALEQTLTLRQPAPGLISTLTAASPHTSAAGRARVAQAGAVPSFSRPGTPITMRKQERVGAP